MVFWQAKPIFPGKIMLVNIIGNILSLLYPISYFLSWCRAEYESFWRFLGQMPGVTESFGTPFDCIALNQWLFMSEVFYYHQTFIKQCIFPSKPMFTLFCYFRKKGPYIGPWTIYIYIYRHEWDKNKKYLSVCRPRHLSSVMRLQTTQAYVEA